MRIIVTGSSGFLGTGVSRALIGAGHEVRGIDVAPPPASASWAHVTANLADYAPALELIRDADALVHIAAVPRPTGRAPGEVFHANVAACFHAVEAARLAGIPRIVYASSFSVLGYPFGEPFVPPRTLPIDETHPTHAQDAYGLSKWLGEEIVEASVRRGGVSAVSLRMPWVQSAATFHAQVGPRRKLPQAVRDLWSYIDIDDAADAFVRAVAWQGTGHERLYIAAADTYLETPTGSALADRLAGVPLTRPLPGFAGLIDTARAATVLGFAPKRSWRDYPPATEA